MSTSDDEPVAPTSSRVDALTLRDGIAAAAEECVAEEVAVALEVNGIAHAVMLATPADLDDFALGFLLSEGIIDARHDLLEVEVERVESGIALRAEVVQRCVHRLKERRRALAGRTGCGLCGTESIAEAIRPVRRDVARIEVDASALARAMQALAAGQTLQRATGATHAAAWMTLDGSLQTVREDVGRHNALDKLIGACLRERTDRDAGFCLITSRCSFEMVQKAIAAGIGTLVAVSAPTALAIRTAAAAGVALLTLDRAQGQFLYTEAARAPQATVSMLQGAAP
jgi:FdhD protein